jgi:hypothetical protein
LYFDWICECQCEQDWGKKTYDDAPKMRKKKILLCKERIKQKFTGRKNKTRTHYRVTTYLSKKKWWCYFFDDSFVNYYDFNFISSGCFKLFF